jgi:hypothetical protein
MALLQLNTWTEMPVAFSRPVFSADYFDYHDGDHVVFSGPTQISGKTQLAMDLMGPIVSPTLPAYVAVSKPRDKVTSYYAKLYGWKIVREWPPQKELREFFGHKYSGYVVWPRFGDLDADAPNAQRVLGAMLRDLYAKGAKKKPKHGIVVMDDTRDKEKVVGLKGEMVQYLTMSGAMGLGEWVFVQKGSQQGDTALSAYSNAAHGFFFKDPSGRGREYIADVAGIDPNYAEWVMTQLKPRQALYVGRRGPVICIVDSDSPVGEIKERES